MSDHPPVDGPLDRALDALRSTPTPEGPSAETLDRALAAALAASAPRPRNRRTLMFTTLKLAAAALIGAFALSHLATPPAGAASPYTEAARKLRAARTLSFVSTYTFDLPGMDKPMVLKMKMLFKAPNRARTEADGGVIAVVDGATGRLLMLDPKAKTAVLMESKAPAAGPGGDASTGLRELAEKEGKPVGKREVGGIEAQGYRVEILPGHEWTVWVDPKANHPVRVDIKADLPNGKMTGTLAEFVLDAPLDDAIFSTLTPPGYTLKTAQTDLFAPPETIVARVLKLYGDKNDGKFPTKLDDIAGFVKLIPAPKAGELVDPAIVQLNNDISRVVGLHLSLPGGYGYKPEGVKLGDPLAVVFWYKPPGKETYRAVYGDLRVDDLAADKVPKP